MGMIGSSLGGTLTSDTRMVILPKTYFIFKYSRTSYIRPSIIQISGSTEPKSCPHTYMYNTPSTVSDNTGFYTVLETINSGAL